MEKEQSLNYMWAFAYYLIKHKDFSLLSMPEIGEGDEHAGESIHLFRKAGQDLRYIRLSLADFVWSSVVERSIKESVAFAEWLRKNLHTSRITALNLYFFPKTPMEDVQHRIDELERVRIGENTFLQSVAIDLEALEPIQQKTDYSPFRLSQEEIKAFLQIEPAESVAYKRSLFEEEQKERGNIRKIFFHSQPLWTYVLVAINLLVFLWLTVNGGSQNPETLIRFGAKYNPAIKAGEWWRLITSIFLHSGFFHVALNSIALYYLGLLVERMYGRARFLLIYFMAGLLGAVASFLYSDTVSVGSSGAIYGLFGALLFFGMRRRDLFFRSFGKDLLFIIGLNLLISLLVPSIDLYAHLGGLVGGFLAAGGTGFPQAPKRGWQQIFLFALLIFLIGYGIRIGFE
ncbi:rhomboid family intramembrane serine protease [Thermicanus aegyptius]|uniref:rhomboid family intramembrane serine protease n=1 Tax=Thermicanus aegyptius TaxID=94009 RepID=UPI000419D47C|nr:rhomboid family intramembrane serine protease [Thermicanus aegyptius]